MPVARIAALATAGVRPKDRVTWFMAVLPVLWATHRRFPQTGLLNVLIFFRGARLMDGGASTDARVPFGF